MRRRTAKGLHSGQSTGSGRNAREGRKKDNQKEGGKMIRILDMRIVEDGVKFERLAGLSTDSKPTTGLCTGSEFVETDTGSKYLFSEGDSPAWALAEKGASDTSD